MSAGINKVVLLGHVGQDPEIRSTKDGRDIAHFSVATSERWRDKETDEPRERTEWHPSQKPEQNRTGLDKSPQYFYLFLVVIS